MPFDTSTRNRLAGFVKDARDLITDEFTQQFSELYGIAADGTLTPVAQLTHLDENGRATAALLRERIAYLVRTHPEERGGPAVAVTRLAREQAFTVLNRLAAVRMAEKRSLILPSVGKGYQSDGFRIYDTVAGKGLGDAYHRYRRYLFCLFDELALELGVLFNRHAPQGLLFPRETALLALLDLLNAFDLEALWAEDETIGWIYQYYNDPLERKKMREASAAPRNSRELAVRNQFFTPRYVVEFLTDNTLGRIWYEMSGGATSLKEKCRYLVRRPNEIFLKPGETAPEQPKQDGLSQEELLKLPVHIPHRPLKDPRTILMLDPACGSMHFGLYAFDLFEIIYHEAWELEEKFGAAMLVRPPGMKSLHETFAAKEEFLRQVPRLIIEHNIHGIDIDPRCAQIAGLSLWLRAQRAWKDMALKPAERPVIKRSNIVCAEPMPGEKTQLKEFCDSLKQPVIGQMVEVIFDKMSLAGEAGSLLKIEEEIRDLVHNTKLKWTETYRFDQAKEELFSKAEIAAASKAKKSDGAELNIDFSGITDETFWEKAEERIYTALRDYAEQAEIGGGFQRRLFAEDAARGFAFIDVCRKRYDVVLMNPPFGEATAAVAQYLPNNYAAFLDLFASFTERGLGVKGTNGLLGAITSRTGFFISSLGSWRRTILDGHSFKTILDLGSGVLDSALVSTAAYTIGERQSGLQTTVVTLLDVPSEQHVLTLDPPINLEGLLSRTFFSNFSDFECITGSPLCYWLSSHAVELFRSSKGLKSDGRDVRVGLQTGDNFRFLRLYWEVPAHNLGKSRRWIAYAKGGDYSPYYRDIELVIDWADNGRVAKVFAEDTYGSETRTIKSQDFYFRPGLTFTIYTVKGFNIRPLPSDSIFDVAGSSAFVERNGREDLLYLMAFMGSRVFQYFISALSDNRKWQVGLTHIVPWIEPGGELKRTIAARIGDAYQATRSLKIHDEIEHNFLCPQCLETSIADWQSKLARDANLLQQQLGKAEGEVLQGLCRLYELEERELVRFAGCSDEADEGERADDVGSGGTAVENGNLKHLLNDCAQNLISYSFGATVGRWDIRYATGEQAAPELPDPFAPLPVCPPGQLQNAQGLPARAEDVPASYPLKNIPWDGILVDDENHQKDIEARVHEVLKIIWKDHWESIEREACEILGVKSLRDYFRKPAGFFADHLSRYSKSRRQAPIYWPLSTKSGSYTLWIYYHRLNDQTLHTAVADFVDPKIRATTKALEAARANNRGDEASDLADLLDELNEFRAELERLIKLPWKPNLNDGVLITASPLWKLFRHGKWQKDLKACWESLEAGEYDWSHLAFTLRPDEVREKCKTDRSLAIAHGLESLCEVKAPEKKAKKGKKKKEAELELEEESS